MHILPGETPEQLAERQQRIQDWLGLPYTVLPPLPIAPIPDKTPEILSQRQVSCPARSTKRRKRSKQRLMGCGNDPKGALEQVLNNNKRALAAGAKGQFTVYEWIELCRQHGNVCLMCGRNALLTIDHILPLELGGDNDINNVQPL